MGLDWGHGQVIFLGLFYKVYHLAKFFRGCFFIAWYIRVVFGAAFFLILPMSFLPSLFLQNHKFFVFTLSCVNPFLIYHFNVLVIMAFNFQSCSLKKNCLCCLFFKSIIAISKKRFAAKPYFSASTAAATHFKLESKFVFVYFWAVDYWIN